jgi:hypothetical protein
MRREVSRKRTLRGESGIDEISMHFPSLVNDNQTAKHFERMKDPAAFYLDIMPVNRF